jgi:hypothetical protein
MDLNDLLHREQINPEDVIVFRHRPHEGELKKCFRGSMRSAKQTVEFAAYWKLPEYQEMKSYRMRGFTGKRPSVLRSTYGDLGHPEDRNHCHAEFGGVRRSGHRHAHRLGAGTTARPYRISSLSDEEAGVIISVMGEAQILTVLQLAEVIKTKLDLVRNLRKRVEARHLENAIRDYISEHPWLIKPELELYKKENSLRNLLTEIGTEIRLDDHVDFARRVDLLRRTGSISSCWSSCGPG